MDSGGRTPCRNQPTCTGLRVCMCKGTGTGMLVTVNYGHYRGGQLNSLWYIMALSLISFSISIYTSLCICIYRIASVSLENSPDYYTSPVCLFFPTDSVFSVLLIIFKINSWKRYCLAFVQVSLSTLQSSLCCKPARSPRLLLGGASGCRRPQCGRLATGRA